MPSTSERPFSIHHLACHSHKGSWTLQTPVNIPPASHLSRAGWTRGRRRTSQSRARFFLPSFLTGPLGSRRRPSQRGYPAARGSARQRLFAAGLAERGRYLQLLSAASGDQHPAGTPLSPPLGRVAATPSAWRGLGNSTDCQRHQMVTLRSSSGCTGQ